MNHAVTVRTDESEVCQLSGALASHVEGDDVVALDVANAAFPVRLLEVEVADLTGQAEPLSKHSLDLLVSQPPIALASDVPA